ncbi:hypothetical protein [Methanococcoides sp. FTZ1]|uniref:hypothetical protein n=1 Tax=Methanococcoides sp. FTZ1 TaxID=3439061 RepID=UPI003F82EF3A
MAGMYLFVTTPTAVTGVKGTEYVVYHDPDMSVDRIYVQDGIVEVTTANEVIDLYEGEKITVQDSYAGTVLKLGDEEWDGLIGDFGGDISPEDVDAENENYPPVGSGDGDASMDGFTAPGFFAMVMMAVVVFRIKKK